jgi:homoserine O-succinyltransferase
MIFDWCQTNVFSSFFLCWGAFAALYHYYKIPKILFSSKMFGVFEHSIMDNKEPLLRGFYFLYNKIQQ